MIVVDNVLNSDPVSGLLNGDLVGLVGTLVMFVRLSDSVGVFNVDVTRLRLLRSDDTFTIER